MNAAVPSTTRRAYSPVDPLKRQASGQSRQRPWRLFLHPLMAVCAAQAVLSLSLVWSNTAYIDEADYLWIGRLEIAHWLHGASWPAGYAYRIFSGSPIIYPPLGALADSVGGLAGARILSLFLMISATVLLYSTAVRLISPRGAIIGAALWGLSEPAIRLAFATFDPLSVVVTAFSAWLIVQSRQRRHRSVFVVLAAAALAVANVAAYSGIVIDPVVIAFAFFVWIPWMRTWRAVLYTAWLAGGLVVAFGLLIYASYSWSGLMFTVIKRNVADYQSPVAILSNTWGYSGMIIALAVIGAAVACNLESRSGAGLLILLGSAAFIVPVAQLHDQTAWSLDKHLAYGIWFAVIVAGYGCDQLIRWLPSAGRRPAAICCVIVIAYIGASGWQAAWNRYHAWPNASAFISAFRPAARLSQGQIYVPGHEANIAEYYTRQGWNWTRWNASLSLDPASPRSSWNSYYSTQLRHGTYALIALFYATTFSSAPEMPQTLLLPGSGKSGTRQGLLDLVGEGSGEPGLQSLTQTLESDQQYRLVAEGPYDSAHEHGVYVIWEKKART